LNIKVANKEWTCYWVNNFEGDTTMTAHSLPQVFCGICSSDSYRLTCTAMMAKVTELNEGQCSPFVDQLNDSKQMRIHNDVSGKFGASKL